MLERCVPDILIIDLILPEEDVFNILRYLKKHFMQVPVLALAIGVSDGAVLDAVMLGVKGVIWKENQWEDLLNAMETLLLGETYFKLPAGRKVNSMNKRIKDVAAMHYDLGGLSPRELQVLTFIAEGFSYKEIANKLSISPRTVESHKNNLLDKLNLRSPIELVKYAMRLGLVD